MNDRLLAAEINSNQPRPIQQQQTLIAGITGLGVIKSITPPQRGPARIIPANARLIQHNRLIQQLQVLFRAFALGNGEGLLFAFGRRVPKQCNKA